MIRSMFGGRIADEAAAAAKLLAHWHAQGWVLRVRRGLYLPVPLGVTSPSGWTGGAWVIGQEEAERLARQHRLVDGGDLMGEGLHHRGVHREDRVKEVREPNPVRLRHEAEEVPVAVEAPGSTLLDHVEPGLVVAVEELVRDLPGRVLVGEFQGFRSEPLDVHDCDEAVGQNAANGCVRLEVFESGHRNSMESPYLDRSFPVSRSSAS